MARIERPEIHAKALAEMTPLGRIRFGPDLGFKTNHKFIWAACPICSLRRWVVLKNKGSWCRKCVARRGERILRLRAAGPKVTARKAHLYALGKAAEAAGLTVERIEALGRGEH